MPEAAITPRAVSAPAAFDLSGRRALDRDDLRRGFAAAVESLGGLDILVASHGTLHVGPALELPLEAWDDTLEVNLTSVFELCRLAGELMVPRGAGKIVTIASMLSFQGGFRAAAYSASKGGVAQLTKALANEWAPTGSMSTRSRPAT
jgi:2-deoxy-D-gluconate 3-dehydrogenase